jgi:DNA-binding NtrC family response regulator
MNLIDKLYKELSILADAKESLEILEMLSLQRDLSTKEQEEVLNKVVTKITARPYLGIIKMVIPDIVEELAKFGFTIVYNSSEARKKTIEKKLTPQAEETPSLNLKSIERGIIINALEKHLGHRDLAAKEIGLSTRTLYRKIIIHNIPHKKTKSK